MSSWFLLSARLENQVPSILSLDPKLLERQDKELVEKAAATAYKLHWRPGYPLWAMFEHWQVLSSVSNLTLTGENSLGLTPPQGQTLLFPGSTGASSEGTKPKSKGYLPCSQILVPGWVRSQGPSTPGVVWAASPQGRACLDQLSPAPGHGN